MLRSQAQRGQRKDSLGVGNECDILEVADGGACVVVCSALRKPSGAKVAIRRITPSDQSFPRLRTLREIRWPRYFDHENIIPSNESGELYLTQELYGHKRAPRHRLPRALQRPLPVLQPSTLLVSYTAISSHLVYCLTVTRISRSVASVTLALPIASRTIRVSRPSTSPCGGTERPSQLMLTSEKHAIDLWLAGCILAETFGRKPLFLGEDYDHQLILILDMLGTPLTDDRNAIKPKRAR